MTAFRHADGFTVVELLVALGVAAIFGLAGWRYYSTEARALASHSATLDATDKVRATMSFVSRELRLAGYDPTLAALTTGGYTGIRYAGPSGIWIEFDRDGSGAIDPSATDPSAESVIYSYDATNERIVRTVAGVSQTLVKNVPPGTFSFTYYDAAGNTLTPTTTPTLTVPAGYPAVPSAVSQVLASDQALSAAQRDLVALVRVGVQVRATGITPAPNLSLAARITVPNRLLDRL